MTPTIGRRDRKKMQTRAALVSAALRLADERGLDHVTVEDISEAADVSSRTFFNYFGSKDEAIVQGHSIDVAEFRSILGTLIPDVPTLAAVRLSLNFAIASLEDDRDEWLVRMRVIEANPGLLPNLMAGGAASERETAALIADRLGLPPEHHFPLLVVTVTGAAFRTAMVRWAATGCRQALGDLVDQAFTDIAAGLPDPVPPPTSAPDSPDQSPRPRRTAPPSIKDVA